MDCNQVCVFKERVFSSGYSQRFLKNWAFPEKNRTSLVEEVHFHSIGVGFEMPRNSIGVYKNLSEISGIPWG